MVLKLEVEWSPQVFPPKENFGSFMGLTSVYAGCGVEVLELRLDRMCALLYISLHIVMFGGVVGLPILIGCEESQVICAAFRRAGFEAYSCDIQQTRGNPGWHFQQDVMQVIPTRRWGLIILNPDCTAMAVSGNRWYGVGMPRHVERLRAVEWTLGLWDLATKHSDRVALENPVSVIFKRLPNVHYIQPWMFGHGETKKTGFALHGLPPLVPTNIVDGREQRIWKMPPGPNRKRDRSETFFGVADATVRQWGCLIEQNINETRG